MKALIDTHSYIWYINGNQKLSEYAFEIIDNKKNEIFLSMASICEMSIKIKLGKLKLISDFNNIESDLKKYSITVLQISLKDILKNYELPFLHRDPFDRIIIAQSIVRKIPVIGNDIAFDSYSVERIW